MNQKMYEPFVVGNVELKNRLVKSAMFEFGAEEGKITDKIRAVYKEAAHGGTGLIITGMQAVSTGGGIAPIMVTTTYDGYEEDMRNIAQDVHSAGSKLLVQLQHAGQRTFWKGGYDSFAVSDMQVSDEFTYHEATQEEIHKLVEQYGKAAVRCKNAGCDGVQIHAAHGFLLNSFLSPEMNKRKDCYGGQIGNRARIIFEIYDSIRTAVGNEFAIGIKIPFNDMNGNSSTQEEIIWVCKELEQKGIDMIEVSSGMLMDGSDASFTPFMPKGKDEGIYLSGAEALANEIKMPVISVCGYRTPEFINKTLENTNISAVSFGRPLVCEPDLPNRWKENSEKAKCVSCNKCYGSGASGIINCLK
ncbi:MAG: hypothetical protein AB9844_06890 [Clostridiaceae bacterium]